MAAYTQAGADASRWPGSSLSAEGNFRSDHAEGTTSVCCVRGHPAEKLSVLFLKIYQKHNSTTRDAQGGGARPATTPSSWPLFLSAHTTAAEKSGQKRAK